MQRSVNPTNYHGIGNVATYVGRYYDNLKEILNNYQTSLIEFLRRLLEALSSPYALDT